MKFQVVIIALLSSAIAIGCTQQQTSNPTNNEPSRPSIPAQNNGTQGNRGVFRSVDHPTRGQVRITSDNGKRYLEFDDNFRSDNGPDLYVILHRDAQLERGVKERDYITLARLRQTSGSQRYQIPSDLRLSDYKSVAIWCRQFNVTFGYAPL